MRRNLFLHFMNRDTREIFNLYELLESPVHARRLRHPLNAAAMLCEDQCIAPPGFVIEDQIAFELFENQSAYLEKGLIKLPIREAGLVDYAEKKRGEYAPARDRYSGLFNDTRMMRLGEYGEAIVSRKVHIGPALVDGFQAGVDTKSKVWKSIREKADPAVIADMRNKPWLLADQGKALTWSIIMPELAVGGAAFFREMRGALQHTYFSEYCREFNLLILSGIPNMIEDFFLPVDRAVYSLSRLKLFLGTLQAAPLFLEGSANFIMDMRSRSGFIDLMDAYSALASKFKGDTQLVYHTDRAVKQSTFDWAGLGFRGVGALTDPTILEAIEISDACGDLAHMLNAEHGFIPRSGGAPKKSTASKISISSKGKKLKIGVFVALEEERDVLVKQWNLKKNAVRPSAYGTLGGFDVEVICPRAMGRVNAAVETTRYLAETNERPDLLVCVGLAGGFTVDQGAVICVDTVVDLANRKVVDDEDKNAQSKFRREDFTTRRAFYSVATSDDFNQVDWSNHCCEEFEWPKGKRPSLHEGKIASVDEVVASEVHKEKLLNSTEKLLGVEMEAGGFCAAAKSFGISFEVLRVVSDKADPAKTDDDWRKIGMKTLANLLERIPLEKVIEIAKG
ncbi:5'-methylthioadenosine/S-adenosylhomocysteine nucleosidase family protein (plasmid) [Rhizobium leguminosarum]